MVNRMEDKKELMEYARWCNEQTGATQGEEQITEIVNTCFITAQNCIYSAKDFVTMYFRYLNNRSMRVAEFQRMANTRREEY